VATGRADGTTADDDRSVDVEVVPLDAAPAADLDASWQDVAECSLHTDNGRIFLNSLMDGARGPNLASTGPGTYRLRLAATDRDETEGRRPRERHLLQVWPAPDAAPTPVRLTSEFAAVWAAPPPARPEQDWAALAATPGVRLIVDWFTLTPPPGPHEMRTVKVENVTTRSPAAAFRPFSHTNPGYLGTGGGGGRMQIVGHFWHPDPADEPWRSHIGALDQVVTDFDCTRFSHASFRWGFQESPVECIGGEHVRGIPRPHPIAPNSVSVDIRFTKHAQGRLVTATLDGVPDWLTDDTAALWLLLLKANGDTDDGPSWPWSMWR